MSEYISTTDAEAKIIELLTKMNDSLEDIKTLLKPHSDLQYDWPKLPFTSSSSDSHFLPEPPDDP